VDLDAAAQQMTEIYGLYWERLRVFIWKRIDIREQHLAEDLASETFLELWRRYFLTGRVVDKPYGLLCTMARSQIGQHFLRKGNLERSLDFTDPVNTPILATGHAYALERPDVVGLVRELDAAMETMQAASKTWRDAHKASHTHRTLLQRDDLTQTSRQTLGRKLAAADAHEDATLGAFREACAEVGRIRAELESVAGPHWRSAIGLPVNPEITAVKAQSYRNNRALTHCPDGHLLDLNNTHFDEDGSRACRACKHAQHRARQTARAAR
jgi:DNA-directed RNA polymerase specialized sigma24 family protein